MAKKKRAVKETSTVNILLPNDMSAEEMKHIIAEALVEADEIRKQRNDERNKNAAQKLRSSMGYKDYAGTNRYIECIYTVFNILKMLVRLPVVPQKIIEGDLISLSLLKALIISVFQCVALVLGLGALFFLWVMIQQRNIICIFLAFLCYILMGIFRMAKNEIDNIEDRNYFLSLFAAITSIISIAIAVVAIVRGSQTQ